MERGVAKVFATALWDDLKWGFVTEDKQAAVAIMRRPHDGVHVLVSESDDATDNEVKQTTLADVFAHAREQKLAGVLILDRGQGVLEEIPV